MSTFLRTRLYIIVSLVMTLVAWYALLSRQAYDPDWMLKWNHLDSGQVQAAYVVLIVILLLALPFAPRIATLLQRGRAVVIVIAIAGSFLSISLLEPSQQHRLFVTPFSIWVIIVHIVLLCAVLVWIATQP